MIEQILKCLCLARICDDSQIEALLLNLARQFALRALELGVERGSLPEIPGLGEPDQSGS
jgi:hypothetical protein